MQNIDLIAIGKMNAAYFAQGVAEYQKRLGGFCNFRIIELPEVQIADKIFIGIVFGNAAVQVIHEGYAVDIGGVTFLDHISG